ncbi:NUDIX domain-containing protein [Quadrisphaera sp. DSM 44207]|uniref:NUDIX domain-containing protein n=1 Tax=Quadrisphaera sp. DSM 44207 TaxID=1881057 RepID=UPI00088FD05E|nr:NUDIX domain-containing protein [Quadrisphaera sp. DSM 44207]SDQ08196.1 8-oxo-dGTP pyrophosphatase MutT, NUDIX family [Quadrisphaera sp. DSM 44207]
MTGAAGPAEPAGAAPGSAAHADAGALLAAWRAPDAAQERLRRAYLDHLAAHPDALDRGGPPAHLTASCLVLDEDGEHALLVLHRKGRFWVQPGGHVEADDPGLAAAALREAAEETGLPAPGGLRLRLRGAPADLDRHVLPGAFGRCREHLDVAFLATAPRAVRPAVSDESEEAAWWPLADLPPGVVPDLPPRLRRAAALLGPEPPSPELPSPEPPSPEPPSPERAAGS